MTTQHTDSVEATTKEKAIAITVRLETEIFKGRFSSSTLEEIEQVLLEELTPFQATQSQQVEEAVLQADATGAYHSGYLAGKAEVEEAVRKERERIEEQVLTPLYEKIDKWFQEKHDIIGQGALAAVFEEALQAITPNHQD